jgi:1,2-phenylacetyl-CoA epoxidase catalytic subunit
MNAQGVESFIELLEAIADNKFVIGDRLVEIGIGGPNLEATLSSIAMAQGELGHARLLYNWSFDLKGLTGKKKDVQKQSGKAFAHVVNVKDWITLIAAVYTVNIGMNLVLNALFEAQREDVAARIHKLLREQEEHIAYAKGWAVQLLNDRGAVPRKFRAALGTSIHEVRCWLVKLERDPSLTAGGYLPAQSDLSDKFDQEILSVQAWGAVANA